MSRIITCHCSGQRNPYKRFVVGGNNDIISNIFIIRKQYLAYVNNIVKDTFQAFVTNNNLNILASESQIKISIQLRSNNVLY